MSIYANLEAKEGIVTAETTLTFSHPWRQYIITNDSGSKELKFKVSASDLAFATLKPTETVTLNVTTKTIIIDGSTVNYRIWGVG